MARPSFIEERLPSYFQYFDRPPTVVPDQRYVREQTDATSRRKPAGWLDPTNYWYLRNRYDRHEGSYRLEITPPGGNPYTSDYLTGCIGGAETMGGFNSLNVFDEIYRPQGVPNSWRDVALTKARLAMKDQNVNLGTAFAERDKTAKMLGDTCLQVANAARQLRRGRWQDAARTLGLTNPKRPRGNSLTSKWLEYQYGWQPLLQDVYGSCEALAKRDNQDWRVTGKGSVMEKISENRLVGRPDSSYHGFGSAVGTRGVFVRVDAIKENDLLLAMNSLGVTNPGAIAWELVPFSFIIDWALPVGDFLNQMDAMLGYGSVKCSISTFERVHWSHKLINNEIDGLFRERRERSGSGSRDYVSLVRSVYNEVPLPNLPRFKNPVSMAHMANGLSVLSQVFGGRGSRR